MNSSELSRFLGYLLREKIHNQRQYRLSRKELVQSIGIYLRSEGLPDDPILVFEAWESGLSIATPINDYVAKYSPFTETLVMQWLPTWENIGWAAEIRQENLRADLREILMQLNFDEFERLMKTVFEATPWTKDIRVTKSTRDDGIDFVGKFVEKQSNLELPLLGQAKHWRTKIGAPVIRDFLGSIALRSKRLPAVGVFVSTTGFSEDALRTLRRAPARIMSYDVDRLIELMVKNKVGVSKVSIAGLQVDRSFWADVRV